MQEMGHGATSLLGKLSNSCRSLVARAIDPAALGRSLSRQPSATCVPRAKCRFEYVPRPDGLARRKFESACLLQAEHRAPFVISGKLTVVDRHGAAFWWWDASSPEDERQPESHIARNGLPESVCRRLLDGWHHLRLETGFEAVFVQKGLVVGSAWQRMPFDGRAWRTFVDDQGEGRIGPHVPPPQIDAPLPTAAALQSRGRVLLKVTHPGARILTIAALTSAAACGWMLGQASQLNRMAKIDISEAARLEQVLKSYELYKHVREQQSELGQARDAAGSGQIGLALASALELAASQGLQVQAFSIDTQRLELVLLTPSDPAKLRLIAAKLESLAPFSEVAGRESDLPGTTRLTAKVATS